MENWLYKCTMCEMALFTTVDHNEIWCTDCRGCRSVQFHHKVTIRIIGMRDERVEFHCAMDKEEEDDSKEE